MNRQDVINLALICANLCTIAATWLLRRHVKHQTAVLSEIYAVRSSQVGSEHVETESGVRVQVGTLPEGYLSTRTKTLFGVFRETPPTP